MHETPEDLERLQELLDSSAAGAGSHLREIITDKRRLTAAQLCDELQGMRLLVLGTATADGRPLVSPVDGYFVRGAFWFSSARDSVRMRHLVARPFTSATHVPGEHLAVTVHGRAQLFEISDHDYPELRQAMLDHYVPLQGESCKGWIDSGESLGARIEAEKMFTFNMPAA